MIFLDCSLIRVAKYHIVMTRSFLESIFCDVLSLKAEANSLKFCMFTSFMHTMTSTKFQIHQLALTLFSGSGSQSPLCSSQNLKIPSVIGLRMSTNSIILE